jgi:hypothetical protein
MGYGECYGSVQDEVLMDRQLVIASKFTQFVNWAKANELNTSDYEYVKTYLDLHGIEQGTKVIWLTPWLDQSSEVGLDRYDAMVANARACELDITYIKT